MVSSQQFQYQVLLFNLVLVGVFILLTSTVSATSPQQDAQMLNNVLLPDGSFEESPSLWRERDSTGCVPWIGDWSSLDNFPTAYDGSRYFWAGGECGPTGSAVPNSNDVRQTITLQPVDTTLSFWYYALRTDADSSRADDYAYIQLNGSTVWRLDMTQANNSDVWINVTIDISGFAGQDINFKAGAVNGNRAGVGNVFFDFFEVIEGEPLNPAIEIIKGPDTQTIGGHEAAVFQINVTNTGNTTLYNVTVTDELTPACDALIGQLNAGDSASYPCERNNVIDSFTNTASVTGQTIALESVSDTDTANVIVINPGLTVEMTPPTQTIAENGTASFTITVTNTGNIELTSITVSDPLAPACNANIPPLSAQASHTYPCEKTNVTQSFLNTGIVTAVYGTGNIISASADAFVDVIDSQIAIVVNPEEQTINKGQPANFNIFVFNIGDDDLIDIEVVSEAAAGCNQSIANLNQGADTSYQCTITNLQTAFTHAVTVQAINPQYPGLQIQDTDIAAVNVLDISIQTVATPTSIQAPAGEIFFEATLTNDGNKALTLDAVTATMYSNETDPLPAPIINNTCLIGHILEASGDTLQCTFNLELSADAGTYYIDISITASDVDGNKITNANTKQIIVNSPAIFKTFLPITLNNIIYGEPNDTCGEAFPISTNTNFSFLADDADDWYQFELDTATDLTIELTNFLPVDGQITAWFGPCNALTFLGHNGDFSTTKLLDLGRRLPGEYHIWLINDGSTTITTPYHLHVTANP